MIVTITALVSLVLTIIGVYLFLTANGTLYDMKYIAGLLCYVAGMTIGLTVLSFIGP